MHYSCRPRKTGLIAKTCYHNLLNFCHLGGSGQNWSKGLVSDLPPYEQGSRCMKGMQERVCEQF